MPWSQADFAKALGTTRPQLIAIEYGSNPLRYWLADRMCQKFDICQRWLATGKEPVNGYVEIVHEIGIEIGPREIFSAAFDRRIANIVRLTIKEAEAFTNRLAAEAAAGMDPDKGFEQYLETLAAMFFRSMPPDLREKYFGLLMATSSAFMQRHKNRVADEPLSLDENKSLTGDSPKSW